ncbi:MAG: hypothetical protein HYU77_08050 [Betaproteobacteria bacterium]|nr:hypothetical protein [Betaproteobacteria bacterium]
MARFLFWAVLLLTPFLAAADPTVLEVVPLKYRTAQEVIPLVQPFLDREGAVTGMQGQLIIRTTPANLAQIKQLLATIDTLPRRLRIIVRQDADRTEDALTGEISADVSGGNKARVIVPGSGDSRGLTVEGRRSDDVVRGRVLETQGRESERNTQEIQVLEGNQAFIRIGQSVPVQQRTVVQTPYGTRVVESTQFRDLSTGFYVLPRVNGERVILEISPQRETPGAQGPGSVNVQRLATTASGRLGEWIDLGGIVQDRTDQSSAIGSRTTGTAADRRRILVKVEEIR